MYINHLWLVILRDWQIWFRMMLLFLCLMLCFSEFLRLKCIKIMMICKSSLWTQTIRLIHCTVQLSIRISWRYTCNNCTSGRILVWLMAVTTYLQVDITAVWVALRHSITIAINIVWVAVIQGTTVSHVTLFNVWYVTTMPLRIVTLTLWIVPTHVSVYQVTSSTATTHACSVQTTSQIA